MLPGAFAYLDQQIEAVRTHVWPAFNDYDVTAIHQARVATRRLKAGMEVLSPLLAGLKSDGLAKAGKLLRRRLGPLRDLDVMIANLTAGPFPAKSAEAVDWVRRHFEANRTDAREENAVGPKKLGRMAAKFDEWWRIRHDLEAHADAVLPLLTNALHARFDAFATLADRVAGVTESPADAPPIDIHELRIDGKAVRYAFEIATAQGMPVPKKVAKTFKSMQDALGDWHDEVVLAERVLLAVVNADLPLHQPALASEVLDVARAYLQRSEKSLAKFKLQWKRSGPSLRQTLIERVPLTTPVEFTAAEGDPTVVETTVIEEPSIPIEPAGDEEAI